jgi:DNA-binding NtrC family response regulator
MNAARILVIEDDTRSAQSLEKLLKSQGYAVSLCHRGDDGFARATNEDFAVVVTDFRMPGVDGLELIRQLHAAKPRLPMVLMTAFGTTETAIEATKHGAFEYILKPFDIAEMRGGQFAADDGPGRTRRRLPSADGAGHCGQQPGDADGLQGDWPGGDDRGHSAHPG